jgi:micrococcal nuclease
MVVGVAGRLLMAQMAVLALTLPVSGCALLDNGDDGDATTPASGRVVTVTHITDGDTFRAGEERIRLIGVDTPEVSFGVECYGHEATDALAELIPVGTEVRLVGDVEPIDRYDRTLAYVYRRSDGEFVNLRLAEDGFAQPLTVPPNVAHEDDFAEAAGRAREAGIGLWSACPEGGSGS